MLQKLSALAQALSTAATISIALTAFASAQTPAPTGQPFRLTSPKLQDGAFLDKRFAGPTDAQNSCGGENISLPLQWTNAPAGTKSFAIILYDFEGGRGPGVVHWVAYGIAPELTSLAEGEGTTPSPRLTGGSNMRQWATYFGPCSPPTDAPHHYIYSVYALDVPKDELPADLTRDQFLAKVKGRVLSMASLVSTYQRSK